MSIIEEVTKIRRYALDHRYTEVLIKASDLLMLCDEIIKLRSKLAETETKND